MANIFFMLKNLKSLTICEDIDYYVSLFLIFHPSLMKFAGKSVNLIKYQKLPKKYA